MDKLLITDKVLDAIGFSEYWDEHGTWGSRTLSFSNGECITIIEQEEMEDNTEGYALNGMYIAHHFYYSGLFRDNSDTYMELFFLHELYECINKVRPECLMEFVEKCRSVKMGHYIDEYLSEWYKVHADKREG